MRRSDPVASIALAVLVLSSPCTRAEDPPVFRAGAATSPITPPLGVSINGNMQDQKAVHIHDDLHARCLVLDDGRTRLAFAVADSCMISRETFDEAKRLAEEATGIPASHMLFSATHTHSAPAACGVFQSDAETEYLPFLARRIADGIRRAANNLEPARIGWGTGSLPQHVFNRRWFMKPGTIPPGPFDGAADQVKMNPSRASSDLLEPAGPVDPTVSVVSVESATGRPLALVATYSLHYVGGVPAGHISADYFGAFARKAARIVAPEDHDVPFVAMLANGTSGDINNIDFRRPGERLAPYEKIGIVAADLAREVARVREGIRHRPHVELRARETELQLGVRRPRAEEVEAARKVVEAAGAESRPLRNLREIYARETVLLASYPPSVRLKLQAFVIGECAVLAIPCEVFVEIGLELREKSPFRPAFTVSLAGGYNGYLPAVRHHALGGYETWRARSSYLEVEAAPKIVAALEGLLDDLHASR